MNMYLLFFIVLIAIVGIMISLGVFKVTVHEEVPATLFVKILFAILIWKMPVTSAITRTLEGATMVV